MNRTVSIFCFLALLGLFLTSVVTDKIRESEISETSLLIHFLSTFLLVTGGACYCGFAAVHATQRIEDPRDRGAWLILIIPFTIFGSFIYFQTKYQRFREVGKGSLIRDHRKIKLSHYVELTEEEKQKA